MLEEINQDRRGILTTAMLTITFPGLRMICSAHNRLGRSLQLCRRKPERISRSARSSR